MQTIEINSQKEFEKYRDNKNKFYNFTSFNLKLNCNIKSKTEYGIKAGGWIKTKGSIKAGSWIKAEDCIEAGNRIEAEDYIKAGDCIEAGNCIEAGDCIEAGNCIEAGEYIEAGDYIEAKDYIKAGDCIEARRWIKAGNYIEAEFIFSFTFDIECGKITTSILPFWRKYWSEMLPLKKWESEILNESNCWNDLRELLTKKEARKVCEWEGWHWILKAQLEMFFELKKEHILEKN